MAENAQTDFFVSYNHYDTHWAEWIAWEIEAVGYSSTIQAWDFRPGSNFVLTMHNSLSSADRVIIVLSENYLKSEYTQPEWAALFVSDPQGFRHKVLPVRVEPCPIPSMLKAIVYIDLCGKDEAEARAALVAGLKTDRAKPTEQPRFPAANAPQYPDAHTVVPDAAPIGCVQFALVLTGTVDEVNKPLVDGILDHLRKLTNDPDITFREIRQGSIQLICECSPRSLAKLRKLVASGELKDVAGFQIEQLTDAPAVIDVEARTSEDFIIRADVTDLPASQYMSALRHWLVHTAVARTQGNIAAAARLLQIDHSTLRSWLHTVVDTVVVVPLDLVDRFVWSGTVPEDQNFRNAQFFLAISAKMGIDDLIRKVPRLVKISTPDALQQLIRFALPALALRHVPNPPAPIPVKLDYQYFSLHQSGELWDAIDQSRQIAVFAPGEFVDPKMEVLIVLE